MKKLFILKDEVYNRDFLVSIGHDTERVIRYISKTKKYPLKPEETEALAMRERTNGRTVMLLGGQVIIRIAEFRGAKNADWYALLAHECVHAANMVFEANGVGVRKNDDEVLAYYVAFLVRSILMKI